MIILPTRSEYSYPIPCQRSLHRVVKNEPPGQLSHLEQAPDARVGTGEPQFPPGLAQRGQRGDKRSKTGAIDMVNSPKVDDEPSVPVRQKILNVRGKIRAVHFADEIALER